MFTAQNNYTVNFGFNAAFDNSDWKFVTVEIEKGEQKEFEIWSD